MELPRKQFPACCYANSKPPRWPSQPFRVATFADGLSLNNDPRYQFLQQVAADEDRLGEGLPELTADFRRFFTVPTQELLSQIALPTALLDGEQIQAQRRCVLETPYMEHFCTRFAQYLARIALPEGHEST